MLSRRYTKRSRQPSNLKGRGLSQGKKTAIFLVCMAIAILIGTDFLLRPRIGRSLEYQGRLLATELLSEETLGLLDEMELSYGSLVTIREDGNGKISSIETNVKEVNRIKSTLEKNLTSAFQSLGVHSYKLPLGTLIGSDYLSGRGPMITMKLAPVGAVEIELVNRFRSAGINQTSHQLILNITMEIAAIIPLYRNPTSVSSSFIVAETVIVGEVPRYYMNLSGWNGEMDFQKDM